MSDNTNGSYLSCERITLTYPTIQDGYEFDRELPLHITVLGDFKGEASTQPIEQREVLEINDNNFDEVMAKVSPQICFTVPNHLTKSTEENPTPTLPIHLSIGSLNDFTPESLIKGVPELNRLLTFRQLLVEMKNSPKKQRDCLRQMAKVNPQATTELLRLLNTFMNR